MSSASPVLSKRVVASLGALVAGACAQDVFISSGPPDVNPADVTDCGFTQVEGTQVSRYDCNPVFSKENITAQGSLGGTSFHVEEVMGVPFYQMWYTLYPESGNPPYTLNYAVSSDGVTWEDHPSNPTRLAPHDGVWDKDNMDGVRIVWDPDASQYALIYQGVNIAAGKSKLGVYTSPDGTVWTPSPNSPVMDFGATVGGPNLCWPLALDKPAGSQFNGYLGAGPTPGIALSTNKCEIYRFITPDLNLPGKYKIDPTPVVKAGPEAYDKQGMVDAAVVQFKGKFYMFYVGFRKWTQGSGNWILATDANVSLATSSDGVHWTKDPNNPLPIYASESGKISAVAAQVVGDRIHLWVTDYYKDLDDQAIGYFLYEPPAE